MNILFLLTTIIGSRDLEIIEDEKEILLIKNQEIKKREFCYKKSLAKQNVERFCAKFWENVLVQNKLLQSAIRREENLKSIEDGHTKLIFELWMDHIIALIDGRESVLHSYPKFHISCLESFGFDTYFILKLINSKLDFTKLSDDVVIEKMAKDLSNCMVYDVLRLIRREDYFIFIKTPVIQFITEKIPIYKNELGIATNEIASMYNGLSYFPIYNLTSHELLRIQDIDCKLLTRHTREAASELLHFNEFESQGELFHFSKLEDIGELQHFSELEGQGGLQSYQQVNGVGVLHPMGTGLFIIALITLILGLFNFFKRN